jgi:hypothetical protein
LTCRNFHSFDNSTSTFISALWFNAVLAIGFFGAFFILRGTRPQTYAPRSHAIAKEYVDVYFYVIDLIY